MTDRDTVPPRVFVSSVVTGFEQFRGAARRGVERAGCEPVMAEDAPSRADTPRNACLDLVESSDAYIGVLGARAGFIADSGKTVVEEEFDRAQRLTLPTLIFVQEGVEQEAKQQEFVRRISEYATGRFRRTFATPADLEQKITSALRESDLRTNEDRETASQAVGTFGQELLRQYQQATLRLAVAPVRIEEVIDPRLLQDRDFPRRLLEIGRSREVDLLDPLAGYRADLTSDGLRIVHDSDINWREPHRVVGLELTEQGRLLIEANAASVTGRDRLRGDLWVLLEDDVATQLSRAFRFASGLYDEVDAPGRQQRFVYNAGLYNTGYRYLESEPPTGATQMRMGDADYAVAHEEPRDISRLQLQRPDDEIGRTMARFRLQLGRGR